MRLVTFERDGKQCAGAILDEWVLDFELAQFEVNATTGYVPADLLTLLQNWDLLEHELQAVITAVRDQIATNADDLQTQGILHSLDSITLLPPVPKPGKAICVGMNYPVPGAAPGAKPEYPILFLKAASTLTGMKQPIIYLRASQEVFCEGELAVVIGRRGKHIPQEQALAHVIGYTIANDVGARDLEQRASQWASGKLPDTFTPLGPAIVTLDEVPDPGSLDVKTFINGELVLHGNTRDMFFSVVNLVSYISTITTLEPGDMILTGSPKSIGETPVPPAFLQVGDTVTVSIAGLGELTNSVIAEE